MIQRAKELQNFLDSVSKKKSGKTQAEAEAARCCTWCGGPAVEFRDEISRREYAISGFCQKCQDATFGKG